MLDNVKGKVKNKIYSINKNIKEDSLKEAYNEQKKIEKEKRKIEEEKNRLIQMDNKELFVEAIFALRGLYNKIEKIEIQQKELASKINSLEINISCLESDINNLKE